MADRLGHDVAILLRTYSHVASEVDEAAATRIASVILGGANLPEAHP
jgi:hypothetical protein